jgi:hypothetical protein
MMIFEIIWLIWFASEILLHRLLRSGSKDKKNQDKGSLRFIWIMIALAIFLAIISVNYIKIPVTNLPVIPYIGLFLIISGMILRFISIRTLGRFLLWMLQSGLTIS